MSAERDIDALELGFGYVCVTKRVQKQQNFKKCRNRIRLCYKTCPNRAKFIFRSDGAASFLL